jgi:hypothetical protein
MMLTACIVYISPSTMPPRSRPGKHVGLADLAEDLARVLLDRPVHRRLLVGQGQRDRWGRGPKVTIFGRAYWQKERMGRIQ